MKRLDSNKIVSMLTLAILLVATTKCKDDEAITYSVSDVSSRITGFGSSIVGAGANLTVNGTDLDKVVRIAVGNLVVPAREFSTVTASSITFPVPGQAAFGETKVLFVFPGSARATKTIQVVPLQLIASFTPYSASEGETITIIGLNFEQVGAISASIGGAAATITSKTNSVIQLTVPTGAANGTIKLTSEAGDVNSSNELVICNANPGNLDCVAALNPNFSFESGTGDNFNNWAKYNGGTYMVSTSAPGEVFRGTRAMKVVRDGSLSSGQWRIQLASDLIDTEIGTSYTVYVWAKASIAGGSMRVSTNPNALYTADQNVPTTWTRLAFTFAAANETQTRVVLDMNGNNTAVTTFFIDDVKLLKN